MKELKNQRVTSIFTSLKVNGIQYTEKIQHLGTIFHIKKTAVKVDKFQIHRYIQGVPLSKR